MSFLIWPAAVASRIQEKSLSWISLMAPFLTLCFIFTDVVLGMKTSPVSTLNSIWSRFLGYKGMFATLVTLSLLQGLGTSATENSSGVELVGHGHVLGKELSHGFIPHILASFLTMDISRNCWERAPVCTVGSWWQRCNHETLMVAQTRQSRAAQLMASNQGKGWNETNVYC